MSIDKSKAHEKVLQESDVQKATIQTAVRFAAIIQSVAVAMEARIIEPAQP